MSKEKEYQANLEFLAMPYPGRIVMAGLTENGNYLLIAGMGGRSPGSKNRYYAQYPDMNGNHDFVRTEVYDPTLQKGNPSTTLYVAHCNRRNWHVAGNGEQTEGIATALAVIPTRISSAFELGQRLYQNEGPGADYTARISAAVNVWGENTVIIGAIRSLPASPQDSTYDTFKKYPEPGEVYYITTYDGEGGTKPYKGIPLAIKLRGSLEDAMDQVWETWSPNTKAGLAGKEITQRGEVKYAFRSIHDLSQTLPGK